MVKTMVAVGFSSVCLGEGRWREKRVDVAAAQEERARVSVGSRGGD
jgi:hypothetical protein